MATANSRKTLATHGINFINKKNRAAPARFGCTLTLFKKIAYPRGPHTHEHFHKIRTANGIKWNVCFASNGFRQKRLSGSRWPKKQNTFWNLATKFLKFARVF